MDKTANLQLPYLFASQAQKHVIHNEALRVLDALTQLAVVSRSIAAPPLMPGEGDRYIIAGGASDAWAGHASEVAIWQDGAWAFHQARDGWRAWIADETTLLIFDGSSWVELSAAAINPVPLVGINATADGTNRLSLASPASLFNHEGNGHQLKINKALPADTASLLYQTGFSGRAEFGTSGDDDFHVKVSADGATWHEAIIIDRATGTVALPNTPPSAGAVAGSNPNLLINGDFEHNQRGFAGGALSAGNYGYDRWKAATGGANFSVAGEGDGVVVTLTSGKLEQVVEPGAFGLASFASKAVTVTIDNPANDLAITWGSASGVMAAGASGVVTLTPDATTGNLTFSVGRDGGGATSVGRIKLELGVDATPWQARGRVPEFDLCRDYFERIAFPGNAPIAVVTAATTTSWNGVMPFRKKRAVPVISHNGLGNFNLLGIGGESFSSVGFAATASFSSIAGVITGASMGAGNSYTIQGLAGLQLDIDAEI